MSIDVLKQTITSCVNDIFFDFNGKKCGITSQVKEYIPTFQCWCGENTKEYADVDILMNDAFFDGKKLKDIISEIEISVA